MSSEYDIKGIELSDDEYVVEQSLVRNKYKAQNSNGETVLRGKQKMFKMKEQFPFTDGNGNDVLKVEAGGVIDVAGNYLLKDSRTEEPLVILDNDFSLLQDTWKIRDADTEKTLAEINSRGAVVTLARNNLPFGELIPHKYEISDSDGGHVGSINGQFSVKDRYKVTIDDSTNVPKEPVIVSAMVIDALQGN